MNIRIKKSKTENKDGTRNSVVREDNIIREYQPTGSGMTKVRETAYASNAAARRNMAMA